MDSRLAQIAFDIESVRQSDACKDCLADMLYSALQSVLYDMGTHAEDSRAADLVRPPQAAAH